MKTSDWEVPPFFGAGDCSTTCDRDLPFSPFSDYWDFVGHLLRPSDFLASSNLHLAGCPESLSLHLFGFQVSLTHPSDFLVT